MPTETTLLSPPALNRSARYVCVPARPAKPIALPRLLRTVLTIAAALGSALLAVSSSFALEDSGSNYQPGAYGDFFVASADPPGFTIDNELYFYSGRSTELDTAGPDPFPLHVRSEFWQNSLTVTYNASRRILGAKVSVAASIPAASVDVRIAGQGYYGAEVDDRITIADPSLVPLSLFWRFGRIHLNVYESVTIPVSDTDQGRLANAGVNYWSFDTNLAASWLHRRKGTEIAAVIGHIYNTENPDTDYHSGQEFHVDAMANQFVTETIALGLHGFLHLQVSDDRGAGNGSRARGTGLGPALGWFPSFFDEAWSVRLRWLHELDGHNRVTGNGAYLTIGLDLTDRR